ncbi:MAG: hypothetical protein AAFY60_16960, partial [Myxococcota bacterium]
RRRESGSIARTFGLVLLGLVVAALIGVVLYLLSEINRGRYRLAENDRHELVVQRGAYLPVGYTQFKPQAEDLERCYAPVAIPKGQGVNTDEIFGDRADLDRALFGVLAGWSRNLLESPEDEDFELALNYVERAELLPGLSEEQRVELRSLRADTAYRNGRRILRSVNEQLSAAMRSFEDAIRLGTSRPQDARRWISEIERRIDALGPAPSRRPPAPDRNTIEGELRPAPPVPEDPSAAPNGAPDDALPLADPRGAPEGQAVPKKDTESDDPYQPRWRL